MLRHRNLAVPERLHMAVPFTRGTIWVRLMKQVVRVQIEEDGSQGVICRYSILSPEISDSGARCLIRMCALEQLLNYDILGPGFSVRFERVS